MVCAGRTRGVRRPSGRRRGNLRMEVVYFTLAAIVLYLAADQIVRRLEAAWSGAAEYRAVIFFLVLLVLALGSFALIRRLAG